MGVSGQRYASAALYSPERTPGTHCTGGWVGPRAGLDTEGRVESFVSAAASLTSLNWAAPHESNGFLQANMSYEMSDLNPLVWWW
jgi:hypothetical protein